MQLQSIGCEGDASAAPPPTGQAEEVGSDGFGSEGGVAQVWDRQSASICSSVFPFVSGTKRSTKIQAATPTSA